MANQLTICNEALFEIGAASIMDINERTPQAVACRTVFDSSLEYILRAHIWTFVAGDSIAYEMEVNSDGVYVVYTNQQDAVARYTCRVTNIESIDVLAATALKWRIASRIAKSLSADMETVSMCMQAYAGTMAQAAAMTQKENQKTPELNSVLLGARFGR